MKSYIVYQNQIQGFKNVAKTVNLVEKVAASYVHFLKQEVSNLDVYGATIQKILARLSQFYTKKDHPLLQKRHTGKKALVILTGDKGLVGGLWHESVNKFLENVTHYQTVVVVGAKGEKHLKEENISIVKLFTYGLDIPQKEEIERIVSYIFNEFKKGSFVLVDILYPKFVSLAEQTPRIIPFLPFQFTLSTEEKSSETIPIFEPSKQAVFNSLLQKYIEIFFYQIVMETKLSELSARTVAMEHAGTKTDELVKKIAYNYTKDRRRTVTQRQLASFAAHKII